MAEVSTLNNTLEKLLNVNGLRRLFARDSLNDTYGLDWMEKQCVDVLKELIEEECKTAKFMLIGKKAPKDTLSHQCARAYYMDNLGKDIDA